MPHRRNKDRRKVRSPKRGPKLPLPKVKIVEMEIAELNITDIKITNRQIAETLITIFS